jgi:hypothetical protein
MTEERNNVVDLDEYRSSTAIDPHLCLQTDDGAVHVIPCDAIEAFIRGEIEIEDFGKIEIETSTSCSKAPSPAWKRIVRQIVREWYYTVVFGG